MHDRAYALATGAFVLAALTALSLTAIWLNGTDREQRPYLVVSPYSVAGLSENSELLYRGVPAGRVERIGIDPEDPTRVLVAIAVDEEIPVFETTFARLHQRGLTGVAQVELAHGTGAQTPLQTSTSNPGRIPMVPSLLDEVTNAGTQALAIIDDIGSTLEQLLSAENREQLRSIGARMEALLSAAEQVAATLEADLPRVLDGTARAADSVRALADRTSESMDEVDLLIADLRATASVAQRIGEEFSSSGVSGLDRALDAVQGAADEMARLARSLAREPAILLRGRQVQPGPGEQ